MPQLREDIGIITGLDIGTSKICTVVAEVDVDGNPQIIGVGTVPSEGIRKGVIVNMEATIECIRKSVEEAIRMSGAEIDRVIIGISGSDVACHTNRGMISLGREPREITNDDIARVMEAAENIPLPTDRKLIHVLPKEYIIDGQGGIDNPLGMSGVRLEVEVQIVTGLASCIQNIITSVERAGLDVEGILLKPLASSFAVLESQERYLGTAVIDVGEGTTGVAVFQQGTVRHVAVLPIGGYHLTNDIACVLKIPLQSAEEIKHKWAVASPDFVDEDIEIELSPPGSKRKKIVSAYEIAEIVGSRLEEIFILAVKEIKKSGVDMLPGGIVITGGVALLPYIDEFASELLETSVRIGYPVKVGGLSDVLMQPAYSTSVGLLKCAVEVPSILRNPLHKVSSYKFGSVGRSSYGLWGRVVEFFKQIFNDFF